ncbi:MAG TPA: translation initiation factor IF-2 [Coleofasciculaceae cyanobacterium]
MNNGKVRIYELSRELNLDNKDILNICEDLNISVKSHSSTITESEAERIRAASEKDSDHPTTVKHRDDAASNEGGTGMPSAKLMGRPNGQRKQQILEIRKPKSRPSSSSQQEGHKVATPQPPVKPSVTYSNKPNLNRPTLVNQQEHQPEPSNPPEPSTSFEEQENAIAAANGEARPQLSGPPSRPAPAKPQPTQVGRPVLRKRDASSSESPGSPASPSKPASPSHATPSGESPSGGRRTPSAPSLPKLQGPPRKIQPSREQKDAEVAASLVGDVSAVEDDTIETIDPELKDLKLRRPTPPRLAKKKEWVDEDEEGLESAKAGKAGGKNKRRVELFDDDEDFEDELSEIGAPMVATLSIARPPKPKSPQKQAAPVPSAAQKKKPGVKGSVSEEGREAQQAGKSDASRQRDKKAVQERPEKIVLTNSVTIRDLATATGVSETEIIKKLFFKGIAVNITQTLDIPTAKMVAEELGVEVETAEEASSAVKGTEMLDEADLENLQRRPPVVTIMGHVDHGKTTLLDAIRQTKVAQGEAGGITQHIGAYHVDVEHEGQMQQVVFLDTPGHEAFTAMRARGARVTDIAILVVAADDGVRPQTIEAISHAKAAEVPIVIAINKVDKPEAQPDRVKQELTEYALVPEEWGGDTIMVPVSALQGENLDMLLEMILLVAEVEDLQANPDRLAKGTVIEANLDKTRGPVATLLVQNGTLQVGDTLVAGSVFGKVRAMIDDRGARVEAASPSFAVEILGLSDVPAAGDEFEVFESEKEARSVAQDRIQEQREDRLKQTMRDRRVTLNSLSAQAQEGELKELNLILKADVQGSVEAILGALKQLPQNEVQIRVLLAAAGEITETDIYLAAASGAVVIGFNTTLAHGSRYAADQEGVDVREYNIIYQLLDDVQGAMEGLLEPEMVEEPLGQVEVRAVFPVGRGAVAGCYVLSGKAIRNCNLRVRRGSKVIYEGILDSLKRMKDDVKEVNAGYECGVGLDKFNDWTEGDIIETYKMVSKRRTLSAS